MRSSLKESPSPFIGLLSVDLGSSSMVDEVRTTCHSLASEAYAQSWAVTKDSLLMEDIAA